jgi:hypothetical protein
MEINFLSTAIRSLNTVKLSVFFLCNFNQFPPCFLVENKLVIKQCGKAKKLK